MQRRQNEEEATIEHSSLPRETDTESHVQSEQSPAQRNDIVIKSSAISIGYRLGEAALVTIGLLIVTGISQLLFSVLISVIGKSVTARDSLMSIVEALSFVMAAVACIITGVVVGLFANRRTMIGSLIVANILVVIALQSFRFIAYPKTFPFSWQDFATALVSSLFGLVTVGLANIAIAMYVARKIRKSS